jgi:hypothetical protein
MTVLISFTKYVNQVSKSIDSEKNEPSESKLLFSI